MKEPFLGYLRIVKNNLKIIILLPIVFLYCLISGHIRNNLITAEKYDSHVSNEKNHSSAAKEFLFNHAVLAANLVRGFQPPILSQKNKFPSSWSSSKLLESILLNRNSKYQFFVKNILESFKQPDIIFPFHYFW